MVLTTLKDRMEGQEGELTGSRSFPSGREDVLQASRVLSSGDVLEECRLHACLIRHGENTGRAFGAVKKRRGTAVFQTGQRLKVALSGKGRGAATMKRGEEFGKPNLASLKEPGKTARVFPLLPGVSPKKA